MELTFHPWRPATYCEGERQLPIGLAWWVQVDILSLTALVICAFALREKRRDKPKRKAAERGSEGLATERFDAKAKKRRSACWGFAVVQWWANVRVRSQHCHQDKSIYWKQEHAEHHTELRFWSWRQDATKCLYHLCNTEQGWTAICQKPVSHYLFQRTASCFHPLVSSPLRCGENQWVKAQKEDRQPQSPLSQPGNRWARPRCHPEWWHWSR